MRLGELPAPRVGLLVEVRLRCACVRPGTEQHSWQQAGKAHLERAPAPTQAEGIQHPKDLKKKMGPAATHFRVLQIAALSTQGPRGAREQVGGGQKICSRSYQNSLCLRAS
jgi:hypothetical protein